MSAIDPTPPTLPANGTSNLQILSLTIALTVLFAAGMALLGYEWFAQHNAAAEAPFSAGWGVIIVTIGALFRELQARGL